MSEVAEKEVSTPATATNKKLYVGSLPYSWTVEQLEELFKPFGRVSSTAIVSDQVTRKSKGFGFVEMDSEESAKKAMEALNGKEIDGRPLSVREAKPNMDKRGGRDGGIPAAVAAVAGSHADIAPSITIQTEPIFPAEATATGMAGGKYSKS